MRLLLLTSVIIAVTLAFTDYEGYQVYEVHPENPVHERVLTMFHNKRGFDFWSGLKRYGHSSTVMVDPEMQIKFHRVLNFHEIQYDTIIADLETTLEEERTRLESSPKLEKGKISFSSYHSYAEINDYLYQLAQDYPSLVILENIGQSYEQRDIAAVKICSGNCGTKPGIVVAGGFDGREWIVPAVITYVINQLVENSSIKEIIQNVDWYIIPIVNPDGYEYSRNEDRLWKKTLRPGKKCKGVDANKNFVFSWNYYNIKQNECSDLYAGPAPFSEPETEAFSNFVGNLQNIKLYTDFRSNGKYILYPLSYETVVSMVNEEELINVGEDVKNSIRNASNAEYSLQNYGKLLKVESGTSMDWCKSLGIDLAYTIELPGGRENGFDVPLDKIECTAQEIWEGVKVYHNHVRAKTIE